MTMSKTHDRGPFNHDSGWGSGCAQPATINDLATRTWRSVGSIPILYAPFALLSILTMTLGKSTHVMRDELNHFPLVTFIQLCIGAFALIGCGENVLHAIVTHGIMEWILVIGLVLEQLPTHKKIMSLWWLKNKMVNKIKYNKEILVMVVMKMVSVITKSIEWIIGCCTILLMRRVLRGKIVRQLLHVLVWRIWMV